MTSQTYELANFDRILRFKGTLLASATSRRNQNDDALRWSEIVIYKTEGGSYVVHKIGKSRVYHGGPQECGANGGKPTTSRVVTTSWPADRVVDLISCPVCKPGPLNDIHHIKVEQDRGSTSVSSTPRGVVESCHNQDDDGVAYLPKLAERVLRDASNTDPLIRDAFQVETIA